MRRSYLVGLIVSVSIVGCGPLDKNKDGISDNVRDPNQVTLTAPSTPTGSISGQVLDTHLAPLADAVVTLNVGGVTMADGGAPATVTDANGSFSFTGIPAGGDLGSVLVNIAKEGYSSYQARVSIPNSTGDQPLSNGNVTVGPIALTKLDASLKFLVVNSNGVPQANASATIEASPTSSWVPAGGYGEIGGILAQEASTDSTGIVTFTNLPSPAELTRLSDSTSGVTNYVVTIRAVDADNDGVPESAGSVETYTAQSLLLDTTMRVIVLDDARSGGFDLVTSNVGSLMGRHQPNQNMLKASDSIYLVFSQAIVRDSLQVRVVDEKGVVSKSVTPVVIGGNVVQLNVASPTWDNGREFNIQYHVTSLDTGAQLDDTGYFFGGDPNVALAAVVTGVTFHDSGASPDGVLNNLEYFEITFNQPVITWGGPYTTILDINKDLNGSATIGDSPGEHGYNGFTFGSPVGFQLTEAEPTMDKGRVFDLNSSGYSSRWIAQYAGPDVTINPSATVDLRFDELTDPFSGFQSLWGASITAGQQQLPLSAVLTPVP